MKCKKILSVLSALALVLVSVLPGFVVPVHAEDVSFVDNLLIYDLSSLDYYYHEYLDSDPHRAPDGSYVRYSVTYSFPESSDYYFGLSVNNYDNRSLQGESLNFGLYSGAISTLFISPLRGWRFYNLFGRLESEPHYVIDLRPFISAGYNYVDISILYDFNYVPAFLHETVTANYGFYDADGFRVADPVVEEISFSHAVAGASGYSVTPYNASMVRFPSDAVYLEFYGIISFSDLTSNSNIFIEPTVTELQFFAADPDYVPGPAPDPSVPTPDNPGSGSGTGSGSGSSTTPTYPAFDDSGIIDSVDSAADKIIDEVGSDISNQTEIITGVISDQTGQIGEMIGGVQDDLEDLNKTQQDLLQESEKTNETLTDTLDEVKSLPEKIMDGIKGLFVPGEEDMQEYNDKWDELLHSRFGALYESVDIISEVGAVFVDTEARNTVDFPSVTIPLAGVDFEFGGWEVQVIPDGFDVLVDMLKGMISLLATVAFVNALRNKFDRLMGGSG